MHEQLHVSATATVQIQLLMVTHVSAVKSTVTLVVHLIPVPLVVLGVTPRDILRPRLNAIFSSKSVDYLSVSRKRLVIV